VFFREEFDNPAFPFVSDDMEWARQKIKDKKGDLFFVGPGDTDDPLSHPLSWLWWLWAMQPSSLEELIQCLDTSWVEEIIIQNMGWFGPQMCYIQMILRCMKTLNFRAFFSKVKYTCWFVVMVFLKLIKLIQMFLWIIYFQKLH